MVMDRGDSSYNRTNIDDLESLIQNEVILGTRLVRSGV